MTDPGPGPRFAPEPARVVRRTAVYPRRQVLIAGAAAASAAALAGCGKNRPAVTAHSSTTSALAAGSYPETLRDAAVAAAVENLAVAGYDMLLAALDNGTFIDAAPALGTYARAVRAHHAQHAAAWNALLTEAGSAPVLGTPLVGAPATLGMFQAATTVTAAARAALAMEQTAVGTYLIASGGNPSLRELTLAAAIAPVEAQHTAILQLLLGGPPVPSSMLTTAEGVGRSGLTR